MSRNLIQNADMVDLTAEMKPASTHILPAHQHDKTCDAGENRRMSGQLFVYKNIKKQFPSYRVSGNKVANRGTERHIRLASREQIQILNVASPCITAGQKDTIERRLLSLRSPL